VNEPAAAPEFLGTVELQIPSKPEWVAVARLAISGIANRLPFSVEDIDDLKLATAEACTTCIQSASGSETIDITCEVAPESLRIRVRDHNFGGTRNEPPKPRSVTLSEGLGVFLIQSLMDHVEYNVDPHSGVELIMTKRVGV
jgi:serine/threonine-protein kinase RsbW